MFTKFLKAVIRRSGWHLPAGPFRGLRLSGLSHHSSLSPKLLCTYEKELHPSFASIINACPPRIAVIGAADGYYSVGLAKAIPGATVIAYEAEPSATELNRLLAKQNGVVDRLIFRGICDPKEFANLIAKEKPQFILMDIEGGELSLLSQVSPAALSRARMLIEVHDFGTNKITAPLLEHFRTTHRVEIIPAKRRSIGDVPSFLPRVATRFLKAMGRDYLHERPPNMSWLDFTPLAGWPEPTES